MDINVHLELSNMMYCQLSILFIVNGFVDIIKSDILNKKHKS